MSKTEKLHSHVNPCAMHIKSSLRARSHGVKASIRSQLKDVQDAESFDPESVAKPYMNYGRSWGVTYLNPATSEKAYLREVLSDKQAVLNGGIPGFSSLFANNSFHKDILSRVKQKHRGFKGNRYEALCLMSDDEIAECVHRFYARKGLKRG